MAKKSDKKQLELWEEYKKDVFNSTPIDINETPSDKAKRIKELEENPEKWKKYYFPKYYKYDPPKFHLQQTKRMIQNPEWFEVDAWSRDLAKSTLTFMNMMYLYMTGKKKNTIITSNSADNAERLMAPYKANFESNRRLIYDYGTQKSIYSWTDSEIITNGGVAIRAVGAGQSPRGSRNEEIRPDSVIIDDIDTDEDCRNPDIIKKRFQWIEEALFGTRSTSEPFLIMVLGNIIAKDCCVTRLMKKARFISIVNIRDKEGKSTWPQKNTEEQIDVVLSNLSYAAQQKEYFNNPISEGDVFKELVWDKCPPLRNCSKVLFYADPSTSNRNTRSKSASTKGVCVIGFYKGKYYVYTAWLDHVGTAKFVEWLFAAYDYLVYHKVDVKRGYIENNSLQAPHYEQVIEPKIKEKNKKENMNLPISKDRRKKGEKFDRIEGTLEPLNSSYSLIFNIKEKNNPHMERLEAQFLGVSPNAKLMDGPDMVEGGVWLIQNNRVKGEYEWRSGGSANRHY